jgi:hypothetical protein
MQQKSLYQTYAYGPRGPIPSSALNRGVTRFAVITCAATKISKRNHRVIFATLNSQKRLNLELQQIPYSDPLMADIWVLGSGRRILEAFPPHAINKGRERIE